ncbi:uncharacterized protein [Saccopteryx leptura]|uniref:uncharacterized protein n=1 Tax=Saccopteryx leptura TaxID=249018 RepID=UPI00339CB39E
MKGWNLELNFLLLLRLAHHAPIPSEADYPIEELAECPPSQPAGWTKLQGAASLWFPAHPDSLGIFSDSTSKTTGQQAQLPGPPAAFPEVIIKIISKAIFIFNNHRKQRLCNFYQPQVFVETLDKCFENVCELDLIFHVDKVHNILAEKVMEGMVLETNTNEIVTQIEAQNELETPEAGLVGAPAPAVSAVKNINFPEIPRNINIGDISIKVSNVS